MNNPLFIARNFLYAAALVISCCFICACENDPADIERLLKSEVNAEEAKNVESYLSNGGKVRAKLTAPLMLRMMGIGDSQYIEFPRSLHADFYNDSTAQIESWVSSKYGKYYEYLNKVYLRDSVVVITVNGDTLKSPDLWWDQSKAMFYTDKYAEYHGKNQVVNGQNGMQATQDLKTVTFKEVTGEMGVTDDKF